MMAAVYTFALAPPSAAEPRADKVLSLPEAIALALRNHPSAHQAQAGSDLASARIDESRSAYLPQLTATGQYQRTSANTVVRPGVNSSPAQQAAVASQETSWRPTFNSFTFTGTASQLIYDFGQAFGHVQASETNWSAATASARAVQLQIVSAVRRAFFQARAQRDLARVAELGLANQQRHLGQIVGLVQQGMRPEIDSVTAETNVANARVQLIAAQNASSLACAALDQSMGLPTPVGYQPSDDDMAPVPEEDSPSEQLLRTALDGRAELTSLEAQSQAQEQVVRALSGGYGPTLTAQASLSEQGIALDRLVPNWWVGALLTWPLFQGGATSAQIREARASLAALRAQLDALKLSVAIEVEQTRLAVQAARATLAAASQARASAGRQLALAEKRYLVGMGNVIELGDSQLADTQAAAQEINARYTLASARAALLGALGRRD